MKEFSLIESQKHILGSERHVVKHDAQVLLNTPTIVYSSRLLNTLFQSLFAGTSREGDYAK